MLCSNHDLQHRWLGQRGCCEWGTRQWGRCDTSSYWASFFSHAWVNRCLLFSKRCEDAQFSVNPSYPSILPFFEINCHVRWRQPNEINESINWRFGLNWCNFSNIWISFGFVHHSLGSKNRGSYLSLPSIAAQVRLWPPLPPRCPLQPSPAPPTPSPLQQQRQRPRPQCHLPQDPVTLDGKRMDGIFFGGKMGSGV